LQPPAGPTALAGRLAEDDGGADPFAPPDASTARPWLRPLLRPPDDWCFQDLMIGDASVHRLERCWHHGGGARHGPLCPSAKDAARPAALILTIALNNDSFGLAQQQEEVPSLRGIDGFLEMLSQQV
jgi:hypothetical protein